MATVVATLLQSQSVPLDMVQLHRIPQVKVKRAGQGPCSGHRTASPGTPLRLAGWADIRGDEDEGDESCSHRPLPEAGGHRP